MRGRACFKTMFLLRTYDPRLGWVVSFTPWPL